MASGAADCDRDSAVRGVCNSRDGDVIMRDEAMDSPGSAAHGAWGTKLRMLGRELRSAYHQVFGIPDYAAYLRHMESKHPGAHTLSQREFFAESLDRKYSRRGPRCC
jgi:uncharacterized short protein YbdD (DUF466 family)